MIRDHRCTDPTTLLELLLFCCPQGRDHPEKGQDHGGGEGGQEAQAQAAGTVQVRKRVPRVKTSILHGKRA